MGIKYYVAFFEADTEEMDSLGVEFDNELNWLHDSGIASTSSRELTEEEFEKIESEILEKHPLVLGGE